MGWGVVEVGGVDWHCSPNASKDACSQPAPKPAGSLHLDQLVQLDETHSSLEYTSPTRWEQQYQQAS